MSGQNWHSPVKTSNLPNKCPMTGTNLQACNANKEAKVSFKSSTLAILLISQRHTVYQRKDKKKKTEKLIK